MFSILAFITAVSAHAITCGRDTVSLEVAESLRLSPLVAIDGVVCVKLDPISRQAIDSCTFNATSTYTNPVNDPSNALEICAALGTAHAIVALVDHGTNINELHFSQVKAVDWCTGEDLDETCTIDPAYQ
ncbi:hypothetical protein PYCC9005_005469 [Savitreella phatthalungensis]